MGRLLNKIREFGRRVKARYDAAWQNWGERSWLWATLQDARLDIDKFTREEIQRKHREFVRNNGICQRLRFLFLQFSSGVSGLDCIPNSENEDWNVSRKASFDSWSEDCFVDSKLTLGQGTIQWAGALFDDGEVFIHLTTGINALGKRVPMLATYEAHRCMTPTDKRGEEGKTIVDGVQVDEFFKPLGYWIRDGRDTKDFKLIPATEMLHIFKARRPGMLRGLPEGYPVMNVLHDFSDLHKLQMQKAKSAAVVANIIKNAAGEADPSNFRRSRMQIQTQNGAGQAVSKESPQFYDEQLAAYTKYLKTGEEMQQFRSDDPSVVVQQYWEFLISLICAGYNTPKLLVFPYSMQGTVVRFDVDICSTSFRANFEHIAWALRRIYRWQTNWAVKFDRSMDAPRPAYVLNVVIQPPRPPNADLGYNAQALETELRLGTRTYQDVYAERNQDWRTQIRQIAEFESEVDKLAKEFGITPERIAQKLKDAPAPPTDGNVPVKQEAVTA